MDSGLTESELHHLLSLNGLMGTSSKISIEEVRYASLGPDDMLPQLLVMKLVRALHCFLETAPDNRFL